jgi:uncharacterized membrane protein
MHINFRILNVVCFFSIFQLDSIVVSKDEDKIIKIVAHIQILEAASFAPHRQTIRARLAREMGISNNVNDETKYSMLLLKACL